MMSNKLAIASLSLGQHESHLLDEKVRVAAGYRFSGIEVVFGELERYAKSQGLSLAAGADAIRKLCTNYGIEVLSLAPFENFEGHNSPLTDRLATAQQWIDIARALGALFLQVPAEYTQDCSGDRDVIVTELQKLSDIGTATTPAVSIAYEPMSWSTHVSTWQTALDIIKAVDRPNFGLCLDSFHILTKLWGNPYEASGKYADADAELAASLASFRDTFPLEKLFYVQLSDGERFTPVFSRSHPWHRDGEAAEFTWSKHARVFPGETELGGYLPVGQFLEACVAEKGFTGWVSMEIFDRRMRDGDFKITRAATRARQSWEKLLHEVQSPISKL